MLLNILSDIYLSFIFIIKIFNIDKKLQLQLENTHSKSYTEK